MNRKIVYHNVRLEDKRFLYSAYPLTLSLLEDFRGSFVGDRPLLRGNEPTMTVDFYFSSFFKIMCDFVFNVLSEAITVATFESLLP